MRKNRKAELELEKQVLEESINLNLAMVYDNRFSTARAFKHSSEEGYKAIVDAFTYNEKFLKNVIFEKMCRIYKINTQLDFLDQLQKRLY